MGAMSIAEGSIDFACGAIPYFFLSVFRTATFFEMTKSGTQQGKLKIRRDIVEEQYSEVADEILKLQNIICSVADFQQKQDEVEFQAEMEAKFNNEYSYTVPKKEAPWWWPF